MKNKRKLPPENGRCCACGYTGREEIECPERSRRDGSADSCCDHWWEATEEETQQQEIKAAKEAGY